MTAISGHFAPIRLSSRGPPATPLPDEGLDGSTAESCQNRYPVVAVFYEVLILDLVQDHGLVAPQSVCDCVRPFPPGSHTIFGREETRGELAGLGDAPGDVGYRDDSDSCVCEEAFCKVHSLEERSKACALAMRPSRSSFLVGAAAISPECVFGFLTPDAGINPCLVPVRHSMLRFSGPMKGLRNPHGSNWS